MTATLAEQITVPGVYDIPADIYHADPVPGGSLSASGARLLLPPNCPARYRYDQDHPVDPKAAWDFGSAAHKMLLGVGADVVRVDAGDWRTKVARETRDQAHAEGKVPLLAEDYEKAEAMAASLRDHPVAGGLFDPTRGRPEQSLIWHDGEHQIWRRARLDWLPDAGPTRIILPDYKTTKCAHPDQLQKTIVDYGYHQQAAWYLDGAMALNLSFDAAFLFVFQEKAAPYLVTVAEPNAMNLAIGRDLNRQAISTYRKCVESGRWPGYSDGIELIPPPYWVENAYIRELQS